MMISLRKFVQENIVIIAAVLVGVFLRLYLLCDQIPLNDEWHGLVSAATHSWRELISGTSSFAHTSPLLNVYRWFLLRTVGWSELLLLLPSALAGVFALILFPAVVKKTHGCATASIFAVLLTISPLLIFYSRTGRPYGPLVFCLFLAIYTGGFWLKSGRIIYLVSYLIFSMVALLLHPAALVTVPVPFLIGGLCFILQKSVPALRVNITFSSFVLPAVLMALVAILILKPSFEMTGSTMLDNPLPGLSVCLQVLLMLFGTSSMLIAVLMACVSFVGWILLLKQQMFWGLVAVCVILLNCLLVPVGRFIASDVAIVLARYLIVLCPFALLLAAIAAGRLFSFNRVLGGCLCVLLFLGLAATSPLWEIDAAPNSFTNHSAFQESYQSKGFEQPRPSLAIPEQNQYLSVRLSDFYRHLPADVSCLVEYPMFLGDHWNLYYFYQQQHRKRVVAGYSRQISRKLDHNDGVYGDCFINHVVSKVPQTSSLHFRNMINIFDAQALRNAGADCLVIHRNLVKEFFGKAAGVDRWRTPNLESCLLCMQNQYGSPIYEDSFVVVFDLKTSAENRNSR